MPSINKWSDDPKRIGDGVKVAHDFTYTSNNNKEWMKISELKSWLVENKDKIGKIPDMIPYGRQEITQDDIDAVEEVLQSDFLTQGPQVPKFEKVVSDYCGSKYAAYYCLCYICSSYSLQSTWIKKR